MRNLVEIPVSICLGGQHSIDDRCDSRSHAASSSARFPVLQVMAMIIGDIPAPWEDPATSGTILGKLGFFRKAVLPLLQRDPSKRPSMASAERSCGAILSDEPMHAKPMRALV